MAMTPSVPPRRWSPAAETSALFQALAAPGLVEMHYQPIHALPGRKVAYYEALARIRYQDELIMPGAFLPVVSSRRLETEFDLAVLHQVDMDLSSQQLPPGRGSRSTCRHRAFHTRKSSPCSSNSRATTSGIP